MLIWVEVVSYYDGMHGMSFNDVLRDFVLDNNMPMSLNEKEHRYISIRLDYIWFKWCRVWMCIYTYILWSCGIYVWLYDHVMISMVFIFDWCYVLMCLYTYILRSCGIYVCLYDRDMKSLIFMFGYGCILRFFEVLGYLYACIIMLWGHRFYT